MVQLLINLPAKYKMTPPKYQALENKDVAKFVLEDGKSTVEIIAGEYNGMKGPASTFSPVHLYNAKLNENAKADFIFNKTYNTGVLVIKGEIKVNNSKTIPENNFILFGQDGEDIIIEALKESVVLILSGEPIKEPIATGGPFVMNTQSEIREAYQDYYNGKFGNLEE